MNAMGGVARRMLGAPMLEGDIFTEHDRGHSLRKRCLLLKGSTTQLRVPYPLSPLCPLSELSKKRLLSDREAQV